ncbi:hypothetical protein M9H77_14043 [Catharanthus roseus]|uniref:Uncharacterized protein n=1 Tax=Catharanthus roseus TaxID=4058 RepID=A0ACC0BM39_CATRO|nr:hypothetical protein M9H77_14043 [Catharanthus roseus]
MEGIKNPWHEGAKGELGDKVCKHIGKQSHESQNRKGTNNSKDSISKMERKTNKENHKNTKGREKKNSLIADKSPRWHLHYCHDQPVLLGWGYPYFLGFIPSVVAIVESSDSDNLGLPGRRSLFTYKTNIETTKTREKITGQWNTRVQVMSQSVLRILKVFSIYYPFPSCCIKALRIRGMAGLVGSSMESSTRAFLKALVHFEEEVIDLLGAMKEVNKRKDTQKYKNPNTTQINR